MTEQIKTNKPFAVKAVRSIDKGIWTIIDGVSLVTIFALAPVMGAIDKVQSIQDNHGALFVTDSKKLKIDWGDRGIKKFRKNVTAAICGFLEGYHRMVHKVYNVATTQDPRSVAKRNADKTPFTMVNLIKKSNAINKDIEDKEVKAFQAKQNAESAAVNAYLASKAGQDYTISRMQNTLNNLIPDSSNWYTLTPAETAPVSMRDWFSAKAASNTKTTAPKFDELDVDTQNWAKCSMEGREQIDRKINYTLSDADFRKAMLSAWLATPAGKQAKAADVASRQKVADEQQRQQQARKDAREKERNDSGITAMLNLVASAKVIKTSYHQGSADDKPIVANYTGYTWNLTEFASEYCSNKQMHEQYTELDKELRKSGIELYDIDGVQVIGKVLVSKTDNASRYAVIVCVNNGNAFELPMKFAYELAGAIDKRQAEQEYARHTASVMALSQMMSKQK